MSREDAIPLSELIAELRKELRVARDEGEKKEPQFLVGETELELDVAVTRAADGGGGVQFWVYTANAKANWSEQKTQRIRLKLKPVGSQGRDYIVSDDEDAPRRP